jgi:hypothetical protein
MAFVVWVALKWGVFFFGPKAHWHIILSRIWVVPWLFLIQ